MYVQPISGHHNTDWEPAVCSKKLILFGTVEWKDLPQKHNTFEPRVTDHDYSKDAQTEIPDDTSPALVINTNTHSSTDSTCPVSSIYLFGVLRRFQHCTGHITTGSWKG